jgi:hypothetical protein
MVDAARPLSVDWCDENVARLATAYEAVLPTVTRDWLADLLPRSSVRVIDVGA